MQLVKIEHDRVTIELDPRDCYWLSEACVAAEAHLNGSVVLPQHFGFATRDERDAAGEPRRLFYEALAAVLKAGAVAGEAEYLAGPGGAPTLDYVRRRYSGQGEMFPELTPTEGKDSEAA